MTPYMRKLPISDLSFISFSLPLFLHSEVLPGPQLWDDCLLCSHDLERVNGRHRQRESHCGGTQVKEKNTYNTTNVCMMGKAWELGN